MRTLCEVNRDIEKCKASLNITKNTREALHLKAILYKLKEEKEEIWNTLFKGYKNQRC